MELVWERRGSVLLISMKCQQGGGGGSPTHPSSGRVMRYFLESQEVNLLLKKCHEIITLITLCSFFNHSPQDITDR